MRTIIALLLCAALASGCLVPGGGPPPVTTPLPTTSAAATFTPAQLKYLLLDHYGENRFFFCDPDIYPVARSGEQELAVSDFPAIENETGVFGAIIARTGIHPPYSDDQKLVIYREYKKLRAIPLEPAGNGTYSFTLQLGTRGEGQRVSGIIGGDGVILSSQSENAVLTCPICLSGETMIDTPEGPVMVKDIHPGMMVWSPGKEGSREAVPVLVAGETRVPPGHRVVQLRLSDGRELLASPGHPLTDGRILGDLSTGDEVDGVRVARVDLVPFTGKATYDILPAGETGGYWANGIPLQSSLLQDPARPEPSPGN